MLRGPESQYTDERLRNQQQQQQRRMLRRERRERSHRDRVGATGAGFLTDDLDLDSLPDSGILHERVWRYLPGEQRRLILVSSTDISFGVPGRSVLLDRIPLTEVQEVVRGDADIPNMLTLFDTDLNGELSMQELQEGLQMYGLDPQETRHLFDPRGRIQAKGGTVSLTGEQLENYRSQLEDRAARTVVIRTIPDGYNSGQEYHLQYIRTQPQQETDAEACNVWVTALEDAVESARRRTRISAAWADFQAPLSRFYRNEYFQAVMAIIILLNFLLTASEMQIHPPNDSQLARSFENGDMAFTFIFALELLINMVAHWFWPFVQDGWNLFDFTVVTSCLISLGIQGQNTSLTSLRLIRAFKVLRILRRLTSLRMLVNALSSSLAPVANALVIVLIVACILRAISYL